jgi:SWI/SNF-related matrix-associated actin-dependent regulator of chromatin subfamily A-like protein 1
MGEPQNLDELQARLRETIMVRRLKKDVLTELPAKRRQIIALEPEDDETRRLIERERQMDAGHSDTIATFTYAAQCAEADGDEAAYQEAVKKLKDAQQAAFTEMARIRHEVALAKVPAVLEHLQNTDGKVIVFAHHKDVISKLVDALAPEGVVSLTGDTPMVDRQLAVDAFHRILRSERHAALSNFGKQPDGRATECPLLAQSGHGPSEIGAQVAMRTLFS